MRNTHGSVFDTITRTTFENIFFPLPPLPTQRAIADTLSCLDAKIEVNNKINQNLEAQAQTIFKSWFVDFEPFKDGEFVESELGLIPKGWEVKALGDLCEKITKGTTPTTLKRSFTSSGITYIKVESIMDNHEINTQKTAFIDTETHTILSRSLIQTKDILFTIAGTIGRFAMVPEKLNNSNTNQAVAIIRVDESKVNPYYIYNYFLADVHTEYTQKNVQQAVQANFTLTSIKNLGLVIPSAKIRTYYDKKISSLFAKIENNQHQSTTLAALRDLLLPKLMSGEIEVPTETH